MRAGSGRLDEIWAAGERLRTIAAQWGLSMRDAGQLLGLSSLYVSAILIGIACRQLEVLHHAAASREKK